MANFNPTAAANYGAVASYLDKLLPKSFKAGSDVQMIQTGSGFLSQKEWQQLQLATNDARVANSLLSVTEFKTAIGSIAETGITRKMTQRGGANVTEAPAVSAISVNLDSTAENKVIEKKIDTATNLNTGGEAQLRFYFAPGAVNKVTWKYEQGTDLSIEKTNTVSEGQTSGGSKSLEVGVTASGGFAGFGLEISASQNMTEQWEKVRQVDFSSSKTQTVSQKGGADFEFDVSGITPDANGRYWYNPTVELIPGKQYIAEIRVSTAKIVTSLKAPIDLYGNNFITTADDKGINSTISVADAIDLALKKGFPLLDRANNTPLGFKYNRLDQAVTVDATANANSSTAVLATTNVTTPDGKKGLYIGVEVNPGSYAAVATVGTEDGPFSSNHVLSTPNTPLDVDLSKVELTSGVGVFLNFKDESQIRQNQVSIHGSQSISGDHVVVGDKDHSFVSFKNSIIEAGNGYNNVVIKEGETGNTFHLGGGGDTVTLDGNENFVDAGAGENVFIIKGKGTNYLATGQGGDVLKFTSKDSMTYITDYNPNEDRIEFGGDLTSKDAKVVYDSAKQAYYVYANNKEIAYLSVKSDALPSLNEAGTVQGTQITPVDFNAKTVTFIGLLYAEALNRAPDKDGISYWQQKLDAGLSKVDFVNALYTSSEFNNLHASNKDFVNELYIDLLGRHADTGGEAAWIKALDAGASRASVVGAFTHSDEFVQLVGNPQAAPVTAIAG